VAEHHVSASQNGARVTIRVGDRIALRLPENATTGYRWAIASLDKARFDIEDSGFRPQGDAVGSGGEAFWNLGARSAGKSRVELVLWRQWEGEKSIIERFAFDVDVSES
jgi:inhibitor of cysteine peptidase